MSISSSEGSPLPVDLPTKYQKLAAEYAKVRSQVAVLKKAILDEQNRSADMKEQLKIKDQLIRKHDQELDSLVFRNQQLTKRVTFLQEELEIHKVENKKGQSRQENNITEESKLFQEELQKRIIENAQLLSKLEENDREHANEKEVWMAKTVSLEKSLSGAYNEMKQACCCEELQKKLNALEARVKEKPHLNGQHEQVITFNREMWSYLMELPFSDLITLIEKLAVCNGYVSNYSDHKKLSTAFNDSSKDVVLACLLRHTSHITTIITNIKDSDSALKQILYYLKDLEGEIISSLNSIKTTQLNETFDAIVNIIRSLRSASTYYLSMAQSDGNSVPGLLETLVAIQEKCRIIGKTLSQTRTHLNISSKSTQAKIPQPCALCYDTTMKYDKKIDELNACISKLSEKSLDKTSKPEYLLRLDSLSFESRNIQNEFGEAETNFEPEWSSDIVKEFVISKCSGALADVQLAESKLSRITSERDAAQSRLEHCLDELHKRESLVSRIEEELTVTSRSYKDQLNSMTEHMANLSDKLAAQETMIEDLTYELSTKELKKGKSK